MAKYIKVKENGKKKKLPTPQYRQKTIEKENKKNKKNEKKKQRILNAKNRNAIKNNVANDLNILTLAITICLMITVARVLFSNSETYFNFSTFLEKLITFEGIDISVLFSDWRVSPELPDFLEGILNFFTTIAQIVTVIGGLIINAITFIIHCIRILLIG